MASFTTEQIKAHIAARLARISPDHVLPDMRQEAEMNQLVMLLALNAATKLENHQEIQYDDKEFRCVKCGKTWEI